MLGCKLVVSSDFYIRTFFLHLALSACSFFLLNVSKNIPKSFFAKVFFIYWQRTLRCNIFLGIYFLIYVRHSILTNFCQVFSIYIQRLGTYDLVSRIYFLIRVRIILYPFSQDVSICLSVPVTHSCPWGRLCLLWSHIFCLSTSVHFCVLQRRFLDRNYYYRHCF